MDIAGFNIPISVPTFTSGTFGNSMMVVATFLVLLMIMGVVFWFFTDKRAYSKKIRDFENTGQGFRLVRKDVAKVIAVGDGGEEVMWLKKAKKFRSAYGQKMGTNEYWFAKGQDGYFYNILLGDLDAKMGMLDIEPIDRDMRYMHVALRKNAQDRYKKGSFMEKYGQQIFLGILALIFFVGMWFVLEQVGELMTSANMMLQELVQAQTPMQEALGRVDSICSGGSGLQ